MTVQIPFGKAYLVNQCFGMIMTKLSDKNWKDVKHHRLIAIINYSYFIFIWNAIKYLYFWNSFVLELQCILYFFSHPPYYFPKISSLFLHWDLKLKELCSFVHFCCCWRRSDFLQSRHLGEKEVNWGVLLRSLSVKGKGRKRIAQRVTLSCNAVVILAMVDPTYNSDVETELQKGLWLRQVGQDCTNWHWPVLEVGHPGKWFWFVWDNCPLSMNGQLEAIWWLSSLLRLQMFCFWMIIWEVHHESQDV